MTKINIVVQLNGGLGNQLFQYLFGISNFDTPEYELFFDCSDFTDSIAFRPFVLDKLELPGNFITGKRVWLNTEKTNACYFEAITPYQTSKSKAAAPSSFILDIVREQSTSYQTISPPKKDTYYLGYWQSSLYWNDPFTLLKKVGSLIANSTAFHEALDKTKILEIDEETCAIHVRAGDYLNLLDYHGVCGKKYYEKAINSMATSKFHLFTDNPVFANTIIPKNISAVAIDPLLNDDVLVFATLLRYSKYIIPNSTYSFLAAYFSMAMKEKATVIAPYPWFSFAANGPDIPEQWVLKNRSSGNTPSEDTDEIRTATISVIIPAHSREQYLKEAVGSVINQTFQPIEIILSLNAPTSHVIQEAERLANLYPLIRITRSEIPSLSLARNAAIKLAKGNYLAFIDDDDLWHPNKLELQIQAMITMGASAVSSNYYEFNDDGKILSHSLYSSKKDKSWFELLSLGNVFSGGSAAMVRAEVFQRVGLFDESMNSCEDHEMWWRMACNGETLFLIEDELLGIRKNAGNMSKNNLRMRQGQLIFLSKLIEKSPNNIELVQKYYQGLSHGLNIDLGLIKAPAKENTSKKLWLFSLSPQYVFSWLCTYPHLRILSRVKNYFLRKIGEQFAPTTDQKSILDKIKSILLKIAYMSLRCFLAFILIPIEALLFLFQKMKYFWITRLK